MPYIIKSVDIPIVLQFGIPMTILQLESTLMTADLYGYKITYIDLLPLFDLIGETQPPFYISPIMRISPMQGGSIFDPPISIIQDIIASKPIRLDLT